MKRSAKVIFVLLILLSVMCWGCIERLDLLNDSDQLKLYGNVDIRQVSLAFENSERIAEVLAEEGDFVKEGQVVARLQTETLKLQIKQAEARVASIIADLELAKLNQTRLQNLSSGTSGRGVSVQELDNVKAVLKVAEAKLEGAKAELAVLNHQMELTELKAPQAGVVRTRLLEVGDMAFSTRPVYTIALNSPKWVRVYVNEVNLGFIKEGLPAKVYIDSFPDEPISGRVGYISSVAEFTPKNVQTEELRTNLVYEVRVIVDDPQNRLRLGMPATVIIDKTASNK